MEQKIDEIYKSICSNYLKCKNISLGSGYSGLVLFLFYYNKLTQNTDALNLAFQILDETISIVNKEEVLPSFCNGIAGIGWLIEYLEQNDFIEGDTNLILKDIDKFVYSSAIIDFKEKNYDFLHGLIGKGMYFLKRKNVNRKYLYEITNQILINSNSPSLDQFRWKSKHFQTDEIIYNLSISHGIASIINFFSRLYVKNIEKEISKEIVTRSINYLLSCQYQNDKRCVFPSYILPDKNEYQVSRLAWCYGDLGIGVSLWQSAQNLNNKQLENKSIEILLHSAKRRDLKENSVVDAGLCHGTVGIAHIFSRMFRNAGMEEFKDAAAFWFNETLNMAKYDDGLAGYKTWRATEYGGLQNEYGFLDGIAGIGLALISAVSDIEPSWDECLLLS